MRRFTFCLVSTALSLFLLMPEPAAAQLGGADEVIVTGTRIARTNNLQNQGGVPGITYIRRGDFMLLEIKIESDARERSERFNEIGKTITAFLDAAKADPTIEMSILESGTTVRNLTRSNYLKGISRGARPDTSVARIRVKTAIPDEVENSADLATKLSRFVDGIKETGRITISANGDPAVSVVNPFQYRDNVVKTIIAEINAITDALGPEYVAIIKGLDRQVYWDRKGDIELAFSLPYTYEIIPNTLHSQPRLSRNNR